MFKKLKSLFIIEEKDQTIKVEDQNPRRQPEGPKSTKPMTGKPQEKFMDILFGAMQKNNLEGFDYLEYKKSLQSLSAMNMDEATRYKSAFAMAKTMGVSVKDIINTAEHYLEVLDKEDKKFEVALENQEQSQIESRQQDLSDLALMIEKKQLTIEKLKAEIKTHENQKQKLNEELNTSALKIESTKAGFVASYDLLRRQIMDDIQKIKSHVG